MDVKYFLREMDPRMRGMVACITASKQLKDAKIRVMPDAHVGMGCLVGFTAEVKEKVAIPRLVGTDIGCGMFAIEIGKVEDFAEFDRVVRTVPSGNGVNSYQTYDVSQLGLLCELNSHKQNWLNRSMGSLGRGNHFIEVDRGSKDYLVIHSGSRNIGAQVFDHYMAIAEKATGGTVPKGMEYLEGELFDRYIYDVGRCVEFAKMNRELIAMKICSAMGLIPKDGSPVDQFHTVHNYIDKDGVTRKGAIRAGQGERVLIPLNMRDGVIIGTGKGNDDWNNSAPHGAGRLMSRSRAKLSLSFGEYRKSMRGVYTTSVSRETLDEAPQAYKPAVEILEDIVPNVDVVEVLKPVYNFKAQ